MMKDYKIAILFSGNGSNLENLYTKMQDFCIEIECDSNALDSSRCDSSDLASSIKMGDSANSVGDSAKMQDSSDLARKIKLDFACAISSKKDAFGIKRCERLGLKCEIVDFKSDKSAIEKTMDILEANRIDLVVLAGFMRILPPSFNARFKAINIHPSILPLFKGANAIKESYESDMKIAGVSVHFVSDELDSGALISQDIIYKIDNESLESFEERIHILEHKLYPKALIKAIKILECKI